MNTETKELLTLAAKAMGLQVCGHLKPEGLMIEYAPGRAKDWNPLTSADDLVEMECHFPVDHTNTSADVWAQAEGIAFVEKLADHNNSRCAARAMASLRVVAEIGRRMK